MITVEDILQLVAHKLGPALGLDYLKQVCFLHKNSTVKVLLEQRKLRVTSGGQKHSYRLGFFSC